MIRHMVLVRFAERTSQAEQDAIFADLAALRGVVAGMRSFSGGPDVSPEGLSQGYTHAFVADFDGPAARDAYLVHPDHMAAGKRLVEAAKGGVDGLVVIDLAVPA